ncbi:MAG: hypothetical protein A2V98_08300 [Planctomycetes bacterium RBG_16_64_12]|nr:MAG: hypothetical protein A2V98_08300 [Planctomycetes bacterium RBG_16_64_12]
MSAQNKLAYSVIPLFLVWGSAVAQDVGGGMLDPALDTPGEPFSYFWHPTDVIGALYAPVASEVTPEGYIYTGFGELMFFVGNPVEPVNVRTKTLRKGYMPVVEYQLVRHGVRYDFTLFAADLGGPLAGVPVNFATVELTNESDQERAAFLSSAYRFMAPSSRMSALGDYRFHQRTDLIPETLAKGQSGFNSAWLYSFAKDALLRDGRVLYQFPVDPKPYLAALALNEYGVRALRFLSGEVRPYGSANQAHHPQLPMGLVMYRVVLGPGQRQKLVFKMPIAPLPEASEEATILKAADCEEQLRNTTAIWEELVANRSPLHLPETKVHEYLLANTVSQMLAVDKIGDDYVMCVNKFQYHRYYVGNAASMDIALDLVGQDEIARNCLLYARKMQFPDGNCGLPGHSQQLWWEMTGYVLWAWGRHWQLTRDQDFLEQVYPGVVAAVDFIKRTTSQDPMGLMPPVAIVDDAMLSGVRQTGQNVWALVGLYGAVRMAEAMGKGDDAQTFRAELDRYRSAFEKAVAAKVATTGNVITSALEGTEWGNHWDNLLMLYPEPLFDPFDPRVTATIRQSRSTYVEGLLPFVFPMAIAKAGAPDWPDTSHGGLALVEQEGYLFSDMPSIHYWQTPDNSQNALVRGKADDQQAAVRDLYALLLHTSSTHAPQEFGTVPWGSRDLGISMLNLLPDGAASAKTIELVRNMIVREFGEDLYLLSAVSPEWLKPGKVIETVDAPTNFGPLSLRLEAGEESLSLSLAGPDRDPPKRLLVRIPWFWELAEAEADGKAVEAEDGHLVLGPGVRQLKLRGHVKPDTPWWSFDRTVAEYKQEYRRRYEDFLRTGVRNTSLGLAN